MKKTATGFDVEMRIAATELGRTSFAPRTKLGFAVAGDDSDGTVQETWMVWYKPPVAACGETCCEVYCNTRYMGDLVLAP